MKRFKMLSTAGAVALLGFLGLGLIPKTALGAIPQLINLQGNLRNGSGNPVPDASYSTTFRIYDAASGGTILWSEVQSVATVGGQFNVTLGSVTPIPDAVFSGTDRWLGIQVSPDPEMTPRSRLVSVGYAFRVNSVDGALGGNITSKVSIGPGHINTGTDAFVAGNNNRARGAYSVVSGGGGTFNPSDSNAALGDYSVVAGGTGNTASGYGATSGGGFANSASDTAATVGGGGANQASGHAATVGGGGANQASGYVATVGGGAYNAASDTFATVGGGYFNIAVNRGATVGGGRGNKARGRYSVVAGGGGGSLFDPIDSNSASGDWSTIPGGKRNVAGGHYSFAAGRRAQALNTGCFVWADSTDADFTSTAPNQFLIRASGGVGIGSNNPAGRLHVEDVEWNSTPVRITGLAGAVIGPSIDMDARDGTAGNRYSIISTNSGAGAGGGKFAIYHFGPTNSGYRLIIDSTGNVGINTNAPTTSLHVTAVAADVATFNRNTNDGIIVRLNQAGITEGTISVSGTTVSYNAFTGSHYGWTEENLKRGELVSITGANRNSHDNPKSEIIYGIKRSSLPNDPACLGSYLGLQGSTQPYSSENPHLVMAVGNGDMWVVDEGQNIQPGDYLISSSTPGHAMKDDEEKYSIGHIVARAAEEVDWSTVTEMIAGKKHKKVSVLFGNFVRSNVASINQLLERQQQQIERLEKQLNGLQAEKPKAEVR